MDLLCATSVSIRNEHGMGCSVPDSYSGGEYINLFPCQIQIKLITLVLLKKIDFVVIFSYDIFIIFN